MGKESEPPSKFPLGEVPQGEVPGQIVFDVPVGAEKDPTKHPSVLKKIKELEAHGKKVTITTRAGEIILWVGSGIAAGIGIGLGISEWQRRNRKRNGRRHRK